MRLSLLIGLAIVLTGAALPAAAQEPVLGARAVLDVEEPARVLDPAGDVLTIPGQLTYEREQPAGTREAGFRIEVADAPPWVDVSIDPADGMLPTGPDGDGATSYEREFELTITLAEAPRAFVPEDLCLEAVVESDGVHRDATADACIPIEAGFLADARVSSPTPTFEIVEGVLATAALDVENRGNGPLRVEVEAATSHGQFEVQPPAPFVLETAASREGHHMTTVGVDFEVPAGAPEGDILLTVTTAYALDTHIGRQTHEVTVHVIPYPDETRDEPEPDVDPTPASTPTSEAESGEPDEKAAVPVPGLLALLGGVAAAGLQRRAGRR